jgi:hypothetical protein
MLVEQQLEPPALLLTMGCWQLLEVPQVRLLLLPVLLLLPLLLPVMWWWFWDA